MVISHNNIWPWGKTSTLVWDDGSALVTLSFEDNNPGVCYLSGLSVVPAQRQKGRARQLMELAIRTCRSSKIFRIDLRSVKEPFVLEFYESLGFIELGEREGFIDMYMLL